MASRSIPSGSARAQRRGAWFRERAVALLRSGSAACGLAAWSPFVRLVDLDHNAVDHTIGRPQHHHPRHPRDPAAGLPAGGDDRANLVAGPIAIAAAAFFTATGARDLDDLFFAAVEVTALLAAVWLAWRWRGDDVPVDPPGRPRVDATSR